jgi:aminopeptidase N
MTFRFLIIGITIMLHTACTSVPPINLEPGVPWELAERRARTISEVRYDLVLTIPERVDGAIEGVEIVGFHLSDTAGGIALDFRQPGAYVREVQTNDTHTEYEVTAQHILIPESALKVGANSLKIIFRAGDMSLNRNPEFLYTLFVPDRAATAIPCFDQPNLKARFKLTLHTPTDWIAVSNGALSEETKTTTGHTYQFEVTQPISTYLFAFAAGLFQAETAERNGRTMTMYHRETDEDKVTRNKETVFDLHASALSWLEAYTAMPYPFGKFDFVLIPGFQYGGMEHPGAIFYRDTGLLLDESATKNRYLGRAGLISHETAHIWFGDLVTMNWFDDVWTKEVFANFMAAKIVNPSFPEINHDLRFLLGHYPSAYGVDRTDGANPIRQPLENLNMAGTLYGAIIYQKAPIVMKHLEILVGEATFQSGIRTYLNQFKFGNATWPDLVGILDGLSDEDLQTWSRVWVEEPGRPIIETEFQLNEEQQIKQLRLMQTDPMNQGRFWNQSLSVLLAYPDEDKIVKTHFKSSEVNISEAANLPQPDYILPNGGGIGYGYFKLDSASRTFLLKNLPAIVDPVRRGIVWITLWDDLLYGHTSPDDLIDLSMRALNKETDELNIQRILGYLSGTYWKYLPPERRLARAPALEEVLWKHLIRAKSSSLKASFFNTLRSVTITQGGLDRLQDVWSEKKSIDGLRLSERDHIGMAAELVIRGVSNPSDILETQHARIENPDRKARFVFVMPALSEDPVVRDAFMTSLSEENNRAREPWVLEAIRYMHHPLRARDSESYIRPSLDLLEEIQQTGDIFFPKGWLDATLGGHQTETAAEIVRTFLAEHPDYPYRLRAKILQSADGLFRAARISAP